MALEKEILVDQIIVREDGQINVRTVTRIKEDGVVLPDTAAYHRKVIAPGQSVIGETPLVIAIAKLVHTPEIIATWQAKQAENIE